MGDYSHLRGYLHSTRLRWSYGTFDGRDEDAWASQVAAAPVPDMVRWLCYAGFDGINVDWSGYGEEGKTLERELGQVLGAEPIRSTDNRWAFYPLEAYRKDLGRRVSETVWRANQRAVRDMVRLVFGKGFSRVMALENWTTRWLLKEAECFLVNPSQQEQEVRLTVFLRALTDESATVGLTGAVFTEKVGVTAEGQTLERTLVLPPGRHRVQLRLLADDPPYSRKARWRLSGRITVQPNRPVAELK
jgi:phosphoglycerol transferase